LKASGIALVPQRRDIVPQLRLTAEGPESGGHGGEVCAVAFSPDGAFALSGGWDGQLRLWEVSTGAHVTALQASTKAITACAVAPDGRHWLSAALDGMLACWDAATHRQISVTMAHTRPISMILFSPDGKILATPSWDRSVGLWHRLRDRDGRLLTGHEDIVAGCRFTPEGSHLFTWSHDRTACVWDVASGRQTAKFAGHMDRVSAGAIAPDNNWAATGSRDRILKLWNLQNERAERSACLGGEVRACFFLLDGESLVSVDANGRIVLHSVPELVELQELPTRLSVNCAELAPTGDLLVLGCADGRVRFVMIDGMENTSLTVTPTQTVKQMRSGLRRFFGGPRDEQAYSCTCPNCRHSFDLKNGEPGKSASCPRCRRSLRVSRVTRVMRET
jgi:WD40 repeat protein